MRDGPKLQGLGVASGMHGASLLEWGIAFRHGASLQGWGVVTSGKGRSIRSLEDTGTLSLNLSQSKFFTDLARLPTEVRTPIHTPWGRGPII